MLCRFVTTIEGIYWCVTLKTKTSSPRWYIDFFPPKIHKQNVFSWSRVPISSNAFFFLWEDIESLNFAHQFIYTFTAFVSEILLVLRQSFVRFRPHLLMYKYNVLSMEYFVDITWFIPKKRRIFHFYGHVHTFDCCLVLTQPVRRWSLPSVVTLVGNITKRN